MKKWIKITLITVGAFIVIIALAAFAGWLYFKSTFLNFEDPYATSPTLPTLTIDGYALVDRNRNGKLDPYEDDHKPLAERVANVLAFMTIEEKIHLLKGSGLASAMGFVNDLPGAAGTIVPTPRLGLPTLYLSDGPAGLRIQPTRQGDTTMYYCTAFPIGTLLSSTWNTALVEEVGKAMGNEALEYGVDVILGPGVNIQRHPLCGRNFEYYSEDPTLTGHIAAAMVNGIESNGVGSSVKHFAANNQETKRTINNAIISERALREIYLTGFEIVVKESQPWTIMSSYNKLNGTYTSENTALLTDILRNEWGYEGMVMSDWFGGATAHAQVKAGNDLLEPGTRRQWKDLTRAYEDGTLTEQEIDRAAARILALIFKSRKMQSYHHTNAPDLKAHAQITRASAAEGMVLLKNDSVLPLRSATNIALIGITSYDFIAGGTGSGDVNEAYTVSLEEGLANAGFVINNVGRQAFYQHRERHADAFVKPQGEDAMFSPYNPPEMQLTPLQLQAMATSADLAIITIGRNSGEGSDRIEKDDFLLTAAEQQLITATCKSFHAIQKPVVIVLNIGGVIETASWKHLPDAILLAWQGGQEGGNAVADILCGKVSPSGHLPMTFPVRLQDHASTANFPLDGEPFGITSMLSSADEKPQDKQVRNKDFTRYEEGIYVGYRHFDKANLPVSYPFGYGLSYTQFSYSKLAAHIVGDTLHATVIVTNTGTTSGKEVVQLYTAKPGSAVDRPVRELRAFVKTHELKPGESVSVSRHIPLSALRYWDEVHHRWAIEKGTYTLSAGSSSRDLTLHTNINL